MENSMASLGTSKSQATEEITSGWSSSGRLIYCLKEQRAFGKSNWTMVPGDAKGGRNAAERQVHYLWSQGEEVSQGHSQASKVDKSEPESEPTRVLNLYWVGVEAFGFTPYTLLCVAYPGVNMYSVRGFSDRMFVYNQQSDSHTQLYQLCFCVVDWSMLLI